MTGHALLESLVRTQRAFWLADEPSRLAIQSGQPEGMSKACKEVLFAPQTFSVIPMLQWYVGKAAKKKRKGSTDSDSEDESSEASPPESDASDDSDDSDGSSDDASEDEVCLLESCLLLVTMLKDR